VPKGRRSIFGHFVWNLWQDRIRAFRFAVVGGSNTLLDFGLFMLLNDRCHWGLVESNVVAYTVAVLNSFIWNRRWTFSVGRVGRNQLGDLALFVLGNLIGLGMSTALVVVLSPIIPSILAKASAVFVNFPWNFWYSRTFVYSERRGYSRHQVVQRQSPS